MSSSSALDSPLQLGPLILKNRIVLASLTRNRSPEDATPNCYNVEYYRQRARGGFALLLTEGTLIERQGTEWPNAPGIWSSDQVAAWRKVTDAVHAEGSFIFCQLWHTGRIANDQMAHQLRAGKPVPAPSAVAARGGKFRELPGKPGYSMPTALGDPRTIVESYRVAAENAKKAGFDGVELHAANGYLVSQFLDTASNLRTDAYGGSVANRVRFAQEVLDAILSVWPSDRVGIKLSPFGGYNDVGMNEQATIETYGALLDVISERRLTYVQFLRYVAHADPTFGAGGPEPEGHKRTLCPQLDLQASIIEPFRAKVASSTSSSQSVPTRIFLVGGFGPAEGIVSDEAAETVQAGKADAIVFGSSTIPNPDFPYRLLHKVPINSVAKMDKHEFYISGPKGPGDGYVNWPWSDAFLKEVGEGEVVVTV